MKELIEKRTGLMGQLQAIITTANTERRDMTNEEQSSFDKMTADVDILDGQIERNKRFTALNERSGQAVNIPVVSTSNLTPEARELFTHYLRTGESRALTVGTDANGGFLAPKELSTELVKIVIEKSPVRQLATIVTANGRSIQFPKKTAGPTGAWVTEGSGAGSTQSTYGMTEVALGMARVYTDVSIELANDSAFDIEAQIVADLGEEFARLEGAAFVTGDGSGKPLGVAHATSAVATVASGTSADFSADNLIDTLYALKTAYLSNATFLFNRTTLRKIRKLKANSEYIWSPGGLGNVNNITLGLGPTLLDRPYIVSPDVASTGGASALSVIVGDFKAGYRVCQNPGASLVVLRDPYSQAANGLVRFHGFYRVGGAVVLPEAFSILKEAVS